MKIGVYPGTFDPITLGHADIIQRSAKLMDKLVIGVTTNISKSPMFSPDERIAMVKREVATLGDNIEVVGFNALLIDFAREQGAKAIVRGLRSAIDFEYEYQMTGMNAQMAPDVETIFLMSDVALQPISSSLVKEIAKFDGDITKFVSASVKDDVLVKLK